MLLFDPRRSSLIYLKVSIKWDWVSCLDLYQGVRKCVGGEDEGGNLENVVDQGQINTTYDSSSSKYAWRNQNRSARTHAHIHTPSRISTAPCLSLLHGTGTHGQVQADARQQDVLIKSLKVGLAPECFSLVESPLCRFPLLNPTWICVRSLSPFSDSWGCVCVWYDASPSLSPW